MIEDEDFDSTPQHEEQLNKLPHTDLHGLNSIYKPNKQGVTQAIVIDTDKEAMLLE